MEHCGERLLRVKGLVAIEEMPGQPAVVHGVQHVFSPPEFLDRWPSGDIETRLVFIFHEMPRHFPARLLDAIEEEVREELEGPVLTLSAPSRHPPGTPVVTLRTLVVTPRHPGRHPSAPRSSPSGLTGGKCADGPRGSFGSSQRCREPHFAKRVESPKVAQIGRTNQS